MGYRLGMIVVADERNVFGDSKAGRHELLVKIGWHNGRGRDDGGAAGVLAGKTLAVAT